MSDTEAATPSDTLMADPRRYWIDLDGDRLIVTASPSGEWVRHSDYAALQAEKEAETKATFDAIRLITQLRDENERLRKAGDAMANEFKFIGGATVDAWLAAKEGRDAK